MNIEEQLDFLSARAVDFFSRDDLKKKLEKAQSEGRGLRIKYGADPSAPDIHLGHVVGLNKLREFQDAGHTVVFIIGDFTGMIGDPSGKSQTRKPLTKEQVTVNAKSYQEQIFKILDKDKTEIRFNSEWCGKMDFSDVIRLSAHVTVAQMLARDDFSKRYAANQPISMVEFLYPLVQAYDSVMVEADLELGGTDQLFNLLLGRELQKVMGQPPQCVMTLPLIEGLDGVQKMSKSLNNYVGIDEAPRDMYGKLMSVPDALMWKYFSYVAQVPSSKVEEWKSAVESGATHPREMKDILGKRVVARFHGAEAAEDASAEFIRIFRNKDLPDEIPEVVLSAEETGLLSLMVQAGLAKSNGEARRLIKQGAVKINDEKVSDDRAQIVPEDGMIIRSGKRGFAKVKIG
ncbi:tyrosine--tRNA ligase [Pontiella sulfatireligans]|uniref:Tyrosine--tRNA ligase n=1 Tax=Pontiella sulfatireligans TaxID=2750658 RepID=A0A6C2UM21_9BACT|nr:tyrosine--tRNA ligase [Pontiella sulfatireligans]VGO21320.1 Tyrosine--tRNA ligase [Pontiella sulfatireligans]